MFRGAQVDAETEMEAVAGLAAVGADEQTQ